MTAITRLVITRQEEGSTSYKPVAEVKIHDDHLAGMAIAMMNKLAGFVDMGMQEHVPGYGSPEFDERSQT